MSEVLQFAPPASLVPFFISDKFISLVIGPVGSTKTTAGIVKIAYHAKQMAPCKDGIRRSRAIWIRNTREQLRDTSIPDFLKWFPDGLAGQYFKSDSKFLLKFDDVECEVLFRGLDDSNDVRRLLSLQASFAVMDEFREINKDIFEAVQGRLGRYPDRMMQGTKHPCVKDDGTSNKHIWGMSNPPDFDTFWEKFLSEPPDNANVFIQPSGLSPLADWIDYLPEDYYANLCQGKHEDWIDVYVHAKFGKSLSGKPVFRSFDPDFHVARQPLTPILNGLRPIIVGMDFGLNPSAVFGQHDMLGRAVIYAEATSDGMGITRFIQTLLKPILAEKFPGAPILIAGDPAGTQRVQTDEKTVYEILRAEGFKAVPASTNSIVARVAAVETYLGRQIDSGAGFLIDPSCRGLINALRGNYRYKVKLNGELEDKPEKNAASHLADALQYLMLHIDAQNGGRGYLRGRREIHRVSAVGWT